MFGDRGMKTIPQGAATTVWAALDNGVEPGGYHWDCAPQKVKCKQILDEELPGNLWKETEKQLAIIEKKGALPEDY